MKKILVLFIMLFSVGVWAEGFFAVPYMKMPKIDGIIEETEWQAASCVTGFHKKGTKYADNEKSFVYMGYDEKNLYVAYKFYSAQKPVGLADDPEKDYWNDDCMEFLLEKDGSKHLWNQFIINCLGGFVALSNDPKTANGNSVGDLFGTIIEVDKKSAVYISSAFENPDSQEEKYFSGEISITWESLDMHPKAGTRIGIMPCRDRYINDKEIISTSLGLIGISFFEIEKYPQALFTDKEPSVQITESRFPGQKLKFYNPSNEEKVLSVSNTIYAKGKVISTKNNEIILKPGEVKLFSSNDDASENFITYEVQVKDSGAGITLLDMKNDIINGDIFSYSLSPKGVFTININAKDASEGAFPITDIKMKYNDHLVVYFYKKIPEGEVFSYQFSMANLPRGYYKLYVNIDGIVNKTYDIEY